ncbi:MAG TPA: hypothetical protein VFR68_07720 [Candidatus Dormibacteraeota bacterium]|nr:hypothetical protein [Candidatus Dormibacteraeota bacterium]
MRFDVRKQTAIRKPPADVYRFIATDHAGPQLLAGFVQRTIDRQVTDGQSRIKQLVEATHS